MRRGIPRTINSQNDVGPCPAAEKRIVRGDFNWRVWPVLSVFQGSFSVFKLPLS